MVRGWLALENSVDYLAYSVDLCRNDNLDRFFQCCCVYIKVVEES